MALFDSGVISTVTGGILANSQNFATATRKVTAAQSGISTASALGALSAVGGAFGAVSSSIRAVNLPTVAVSEGIPSAGTMLSVARAVEKAATELKETTIYNAYVEVFDTIKLIAQSGNYSYELVLTPQQQAELTPLLTKYGYTTGVIKSSGTNNYISISWGKSNMATSGVVY